MFNPCGCGDPLAGAEVYVSKADPNWLVRAKKMERSFAVQLDGQLLKGAVGDYLVEETGGRKLPATSAIFEASYTKLVKLDLNLAPERV